MKRDSIVFSTLMPEPGAGFGLPVITAEQQKRIDECAMRVRVARNAAQYSPCLPLEKRRPGPGEMNCAQCAHLHDVNAEQERGWCYVLRQMKSTWHPCSCMLFKAKSAA